MSVQKEKLTRRQAIRGSVLATMTAATALLTGCVVPKTAGTKRRAARRNVRKERAYIQSLGG